MPAYSDIQTSVQSLLNRRDATTAQIQSFIQSAIMRIQRDLRVPAMEKAAVVTIAYPQASFTGSITDNLLTVTDITAGTIITGQPLTDPLTNLIAADTSITSWVSGVDGGVGVYQVSQSQTVASEAMQSQMTFPGLAIPTDFLELIDLIPIATGGGQLDPFDVQRLGKVDLTKALQMQATTGFPEVYARQGGYWIIGNAPMPNDQIQIDYYAEFTQLVNPTDTNILLTVAWDLVLYGALSDACLFFTDKRRGTSVNPMTGKITDGFEGKFNSIFDSLQDMAEQDDASGAVSVQPAYRIPGNVQDEYEDIYWVP